jgi:hypothetical protein
MSEGTLCIEVFVLTRESPQSELDQCMAYLKKNFEEKSFKSIQLVIKKEAQANGYSPETRLATLEQPEEDEQLSKSKHLSVSIYSFFYHNTSHYFHSVYL